ncbi:MAG: ABC transporter substrate-binding protein [Candidatus Eiseniibacteriota bacterium]
MRRAAAAAGAPLTLSASEPSEAPADRPIVLGAVLPLSGEEAHTGEEILEGLELAAEVEDAAPPLAIRAADGEAAPAASVHAFRELAGDPEVSAVVGGWFASTGRTLTAVAGTAGVPLLVLSPLAGASQGDVFPLHRISALGEAAARFAYDELDARRAGILRLPGGEVSGRLADAFAAAFTRPDSRLVWSISPDGAGRLALPAGPAEPVDAIFVAGAGEWAERCSALGASTREAAILTVTGWQTDGLDRLAAGGVPVYLVSFFSATDPSPANRRLLEACARTGREPTPALALGWDVGRLIRHAALVGGRDRDGIRTGLRGGAPFSGATGRLDFGWAGTPRETPAVSSLSSAGLVFLRRVEVPAQGGG